MSEMSQGTANGIVLGHSLDWTLGNLYKITSKWNLNDNAKPGSYSILHLKYGAITSLF